MLLLQDNLVTGDSYPFNPQELVYERTPNRSPNQPGCLYLYSGVEIFQTCYKFKYLLLSEDKRGCFVRLAP